MVYKDLDISIARFEDGVAIVPLPDGQILCIPEEDATIEELEIISEIKLDVESRPVEEIEEPEPEPSIDEYLVDLDFRLSMIELGI